MIPYGRQNISDEDIEAVVDVLRSDWLTQGPAVPTFEKHLCEYTGAAHAVAVNSATSALHIACMALGLKPGGRLWTSPITFVASANCGLYCGAAVDFVDIDPATANMSVVALEAKLVEAEAAGELPDIVVPVHMAGQSCEMEGIHRLSKHYGFRVIEDASHAIGGSYQGQKVGGCRYSDITVFSFHPVKIVTTGEGGVAMTNAPGLAAAMQRLRSHGVTRDPELMQGETEGAWYYQQIELGFNYRMTDIQAALGASQLQRVNGFVARRRQLANRYDSLLATMPLKPLDRLPEAESAWHLYIAQLDDPSRRRPVFEHLRAAGIGVNVHYIPVHMQPYYRQLGFGPGDFPLAEAWYRGAISLPLFPDLSEADQDRVVNGLQEAVQV